MLATIYVVDDCEEFRTGLAQALAAAGFEVWQAADGTQVLEAMRRVSTRDAEARRPDLLLVDLLMPTVGAADLLRLLRDTHRWANVPFVVMTGHDPRAVSAELKVAAVGKAELAGMLPAISRAIGRRMGPKRRPERSRRHDPSAVRAAERAISAGERGSPARSR